jgi:hypothetical protein
MTMSPLNEDALSAGAQPQGHISRLSLEGAPMLQSDYSQPIKNESLIPTEHSYLILALLILFTMGLLSRLYDVGSPLLDFHPTRQYHTALIARSMYLDSLDDVPEWRCEVVRLNRDYEGVLESLRWNHWLC